MTRCRECGADADNGEGWDGMCGDCADKAEKAEIRTYTAYNVTRKEYIENITADVLFAMVSLGGPWCGDRIVVQHATARAIDSPHYVNRRAQRNFSRAV